MKYANLFAKYNPLTGKAWIKSIPEEDRKVLAYIGYTTLALSERNLHSMGGRARVQTAERDHRGRFIKRG